VLALSDVLLGLFSSPLTQALAFLVELVHEGTMLLLCEVNRGVNATLRLGRRQRIPLPMDKKIRAMALLRNLSASDRFSA